MRATDRRPSPIQIYYKIYLPLMAPAWSRHGPMPVAGVERILYQFLLSPNDRR